MSELSGVMMGKIIGITGGIASGKSTVTDFLRKQGYQVVDADQVVHELQKPGEKLFQVLLSEFGSDIIQTNGFLDRKKLGQIVFADATLLTKINQLQGEIIREELAMRCRRLVQKEELFFMDIPLLFEQGYEDWFDEIWFIDLQEETQIERLQQRNDLSVDEAKKRIASQLSSQEKRQRADMIIDNNGKIEDTLQQVAILLNRERR